MTAGCTTSRPISANDAQLAQAARQIFGTSLIGARGATPRDQNAIDEAVAGACGAGAYTKSECARHEKE